MTVLVDTPVRSEYIRRDAPNMAIQGEMELLIQAGRAAPMAHPTRGPLMGSRPKAVSQAKERLSCFEDQMVSTTEYDLAAEFHRLYRSNGVQGSNTDSLVCSIAAKRGMPVFTPDGDFALFVKLLPIQLHIF